MDELDETPSEEPEIKLTPVKLSKAYEPPEAEETFEALERLLEEQSIDPQEEEAAPLSNAPLENRSEVDSKDRLNYRLNYTEQRRLERGEEEARESEFEQTWQGRLGRWPVTRWFIDRRTRRLERLIAFGALVAIAGVALSFGLTHRDVGSSKKSATGGDEPIESLGQLLLEEEEESAEIITQFFQATSLDEMMALVRHPDVVKPLMEAWYAENSIQQESDLVFESAVLKRVNGARYFMHFVYFKDALEPRPIAVERTDDGFRVDWETVVGYQRMAWDQYRTARPAEKVYVRVQARLDDYHNFEFTNSHEWSCFRLNHPDDNGAIYGYVKRFSEMDRQLRDAMGKDEKGADYFILGLRFPDEAQSDQAVYIDEVVQQGWVRAYAPGERHFDLPDA